MLVSDFGDFDNDDALDTEPADAEQVARRLHFYRMSADITVYPWDDLSDEERERDIEIVIRLLAWLRRQGAFR